MMELVTGGSGSGKSACAEDTLCRLHRQLCQERGKSVPLYYIADMIPYGEETQRKIEAHRRMRAGKGFVTLEWYLDLPGRITGEDHPDLEGSCVLLECISNLTANEMYEPGGSGQDAAERIIRGVRMLKERCAHLVVVTNDVFRECAPDQGEMALYKENLGRINRALARMADKVTEVIYGGCQTYWTEAKNDISDSGSDRNMAGMILVTGGAYQGKLDCAKRLAPGLPWTDGAQCALEEIETCRAVDHFHLYVRRWMQAGKSARELACLIAEKNKDMMIVCDEVGCGLVPVDASEREYREAVGRIMTELSGYAKEVYRVTCGICTRLK